MDWIYNVPIKFFEYDLEEFKHRLLEFENQNILLIASKRLISTFDLKTDDFNLISNSISNPDINLLNEILNDLTGKPETIIAIGGGSTIDLAKAISAFYDYKDNLDKDKILDLLKSKEYLDNNEHIPIIAIPTTAGTGSECTKWATIWDFKNFKKYSIDADYLYPKEAWLIPELTLTLPINLTLSTGLDALAHATEAYWAVSSNEYVQALSRVAINIIVEYLPKVVNDLDNLEYRQKMLMGSFFAGLSFSNTRTTACHSISYPLTMLFGINHGYAVAITFFEVLKRNWKYVDDKELFLQAWNAKNIQDIQEWLNNITSSIQKLDLASFGVNQKDLNDIVKLASTGGRMDNNPIIFNEFEINDILEKIYKIE